jgi:glycosyltransferase involved in cell wall biosynthesis
MKVLQVLSYSLVFLHDGPSIGVLHISRALAKQGHEVTVFTTDSLRLKSRLEVQENPMWIDGVQVYHFRNLSNQLARKKLPVALDMASALKKHLERFDLVHLHEYRTFNAVFVHHYAKKKNTPFVLQPHGSLPRVRYELRERHLFRLAFDTAFGLRIVGDANKVIASQETEANHFRQMGVDEHRIRVIPPHAIDALEDEQLPEKGVFKRKYGLEEDLVILYLGRIHKTKGIDLLLDAFCRISTELPNVKLLITGPDDGFWSTLEKKTKDAQMDDRVIFTGPLYGNSKLEALRDADVYVLPSIYESFGRTVLEACMCGTPVIVTDRCGIADVVKKYGLVVEYDVESLSAALLSILKDEAKRRELAEKAKDLVRFEYRPERITEDTERLYQDVVSH